MKILVGIVTFNPIIDILANNIRNLLKSANFCLIIDNGSKNQNDLKEFKYNNFLLISNQKNMGIGFALNQIFKFAKENGIDWVLTLDQDSIPADGLIEEYKKYTNLPSIGLLTCNIYDKNLHSLDRKQGKEVMIINRAITSGSFCSVDAFFHTPGFDSLMFIDSVDFDYCCSLKKAGYNIFKIPFGGLTHEIGNGKIINFLGLKIKVYNETSFRQFYMARNHFYLSHKYPKEYPFLKEVLREIKDRLIILLFEKNKKEKLKSRRLGCKAFRKKFWRKKSTT